MKKIESNYSNCVPVLKSGLSHGHLIASIYSAYIGGKGQVRGNSGVNMALLQHVKRYAAILFVLLTVGSGEMWGAAGLKGSWDSWTYHDLTSGSCEITLPAETEYEFVIDVDNKGYSYTNQNFTNTSTSFQIYENNGNCKITTGEAGTYIFKTWYDNGRYMAVYFPQARLEKQKYIYFDARNETNWNSANFNARFWFKYYDSGSDVGSADCEKGNALENWVYYALVPDNDYVGQIQMNRINPNYSGEGDEVWCTAEKAYAKDRTSSLQNCLKEETGKEDYCNSWTPAWTTYCPPMSSVTLEDNGTTNWGGDGSSDNPYLVPTSGDIQVHVTAYASALNDANMTQYFLFKKAGSAVGEGSSTTEKTITASGTTGTKEAVTVDAYNYYNSTEGTHLTSSAIYYEARTPYTISYNAGTGGSGSRASETKLKGVNFALPNVAVFTRTGYKQTGWTTSDGGAQTHAFGANYTGDAAQTFYPAWTARNEIEFVVNGEHFETIYRANDEAMKAVLDGQGAMPADPADNTLAGCGLNKFVGWSTTNIGGDALTTAPADLFSNASAGEVTVSGNTTFYAVFAEVPEGALAVNTVLWSEDWTGEANNAIPEAPTTSGGTQITGANVTYSWTNGTGGTPGTSKVTHDNGGDDAGGSCPEAMIGKKGSGTGALGGNLTVLRIPRKNAKKLSLTFKQKQTLQVEIPTEDCPGYQFSNGQTSISNTASTAKEISDTIICGEGSTFNLIFRATTTSNVRLDDIVVKVLDNGITNYRTACPSMTVTAHPATTGTPFFITSSASKTVRSQDSVHIVGSNLTKEGAVSITGVSSKFVLKSAKNGEIKTRSNGTIDTIAYIYYTPDAGDTEDGLDINANFTISVAGAGATDYEVSQSLIGRHLPANFVIAAKSGDTWYALPANNSKSDNGTPTPIELTVDNVTSPTKALTSSSHIYTLYGQTNTVLGGGNGQYVKLAMNGQNNAPLCGDNSSGSSTTKIGKGQGSVVTNDQSADYWWALTQTNTSISNSSDAKYIVTVSSNAKHLRLWENAGGMGNPQWGLYAYGIDEIRLIPWYADEVEAEAKEWSADAMAVETSDIKSATQVKATVGASSSGKVTVTHVEGNTYFFDFNGGMNLSGNADKKMTLDWYNSSDELVAASWLTVPRIIDAGEASTWSTIASAPTLDDIVVISKPMEINVTNAKAKRVIIDQRSSRTGQVEISAGKELIVKETVRKLDATGFGATEENDIVFGSTLGAGLGALVMGEHNGTNQATVNFATLSHGATGSSASVNQYIGTPFTDATVLSDWYNSWVYRVTYPGGIPTWTRVGGDELMTPFNGYCVISADAVGHSYWMQGTLVNSEDKSATLVYNGATVANNENLLANSWMAPIQINAFEASDFGGATETIYIFNSGSPDDGNGSKTDDTPGNYSAFTPGTALDTDVIPAMQSFSIYSTAASQTVSLDYSKLVYDPAVAGLAIQPNRAPERRRVGGEEMEFLKARVAGENGWADEVKIYSRENFVTEYENGFDGPKMFGESVAPQMYAITPDGNMAINCVPTMEGTVLGFRKGSSDSEYTFSFEYEGAETLYLNDLKAQVSTLIDAASSYTFTAAADDDEARFIISATPIGQMPTEVETPSGSPSRGEKILINGQLYIIRHGRMYSAEGVRVK